MRIFQKGVRSQESEWRGFAAQELLSGERGFRRRLSLRRGWWTGRGGTARHCCGLNEVVAQGRIDGSFFGARVFRGLGNRGRGFRIFS